MCADLYLSVGSECRSYRCMTPVGLYSDTGGGRGVIQKISPSEIWRTLFLRAFAFFLFDQWGRLDWGLFLEFYTVF